MCPKLLMANNYFGHIHRVQDSHSFYNRTFILILLYNKVHDSFILGSIITFKYLLWKDFLYFLFVCVQGRFLAFPAEQHPIILQIGGSNIDNLSKATELANAYSYDEINLK